MKIYTKTGDDGTSGLFDGKRKSKDDPRFVAIGDVDELNASLGVARIYGDQIEKLGEIFDYLQDKLFVVGADLATTNEKMQVPRVGKKEAAALEEWIDALTVELKPLRRFVLPGGGAAAAYLHLARAICRRTERSLVTLRKADFVHEEVLIFINRLSDLLFTMARFANAKSGGKEIEWVSS